MKVYVLRYDREDAHAVQIAIGGLATYGRPPWEERTANRWLEIYSPNRHVMRQVWRLTRRWVKDAPLTVDTDEDPQYMPLER